MGHDLETCHRGSGAVWLRPVRRGPCGSTGLGRPARLRLPGTVETQEVRLSSRVGGRVAKVLVKESQLVEPGQTIVELEMPELDAQRAQLVAQKEAAEAVLARLEKGSRDEEKAAAKASLAAAAGAAGPDDQGLSHRGERAGPQRSAGASTRKCRTRWPS